MNGQIIPFAVIEGRRKPPAPPKRPSPYSQLEALKTLDPAGHRAIEVLTAALIRQAYDKATNGG